MFRKLFGFGKKKEEKENVEQIEENVEQSEESARDEAASSEESLTEENLTNEENLSSAIETETPLSEIQPSAAQEETTETLEKLEQVQEMFDETSAEQASEKFAQALSDTTETSETIESMAEMQDDLTQEEKSPEFSDEEMSEEMQAEQEEPEEELGFFAKLKKGLSKTTKNFSKKLDELFLGYSKIDDEIFEELEELLVLGDLGFETAIGITEELRKRADEKKIENVSDLEQELENIIEEILLSSAREESENEYPQIIVVVGVNGVGKTTSIGKIASQLKNEGKSVMLAAGDTFRAAAADQLEIWAGRSDVPIVRSNEGADPSAVIFDAIKSAQAKKTDVLICDTAGRLHNKKNLMNELEKIFRIVNREYPEAKKEVFLVIDATTGQNAINQAKTFSEVAQLTGIILTKLDGTAKGGVVIGLSKELQVPIRYVGVGEKINDLQKFNAREFARALFSKNE
ncbi:MAG: signal recognition particle-docking protein FtsY [Peptostreptococcaceae bacterium]|nr:signal recognition particle-docking protein FtsY [Peptostreptococcaceae bacterium]